ncbi:MAG: LPS assembly lipoprotein LptE [Saprospiraceae bacterium]
MKVAFRFLQLIILSIILSSATCSVTLDNKSIDPEIKTFYVKNFNVVATNAPATLGEEFAEELRFKVRSDTRLNYTDISPDIEFEGRITGFDIRPAAIREGETVQLNQLTIRIDVDYINNLNEEKNWNKPFSFFVNYDADSNLLDVQDGLVDEIFDRLIQDIFQEAFRSW